MKCNRINAVERDAELRKVNSQVYFTKPKASRSKPKDRFVCKDIKISQLKDSKLQIEINSSTTTDTNWRGVLCSDVDIKEIKNFCRKHKIQFIEKNDQAEENEKKKVSRKAKSKAEENEKKQISTQQKR